MKKYSHNIHSKEKGFTLLFAVLVSTLVVSIGASIISIALRQTILSGTSRESQYAFYAANTVLECAFYWDITNANVFPSSGEDQLAQGDNGADTIKCAGGNIITGNDFVDSNNFTGAWDPDTSNYTTTFFIKIQDEGSSVVNTSSRCAQATVTKTQNSATGIITTRIEAKGYNSCDLTHPRTVERGLVQVYTS